MLAEAFGVLPTIRRDRFDITDAAYHVLCAEFSSWRLKILKRNS